jgi:hypothetical protein
MKRRLGVGLTATLVGLAVLMIFIPAASANQRRGAGHSGSGFRPTRGVIPPRSLVGGQTYSQLSAEFWEWVFDTPLHGPSGQVAQAAASSSGPVDCSYGQQGNVWFLQPPIAGFNSPVNRTCTIPGGTIIFFPVYNGWDDNLNLPGEAPTTYTASQLRATVASSLSNASQLSASIDGRTVADLNNLSSPYRARSPLFHYTLPADSFYNAYFGLTWPAGTMTPPPGAVSDGVWVALRPLSPGNHTVHFSATGSGLSEDVTYTVIVSKRHTGTDEPSRSRPPDS